MEVKEYELELECDKNVWKWLFHRIKSHYIMLYVNIIFRLKVATIGQLLVHVFNIRFRIYELRLINIM